MYISAQVAMALASSNSQFYNMFKKPFQVAIADFLNKKVQGFIFAVIFM